LKIERGSNRSIWVENSLWKRLWTCSKADSGRNIYRMFLKKYGTTNSELYPQNNKEELSKQGCLGCFPRSGSFEKSAQRTQRL